VCPKLLLRNPNKHKNDDDDEADTGDKRETGGTSIDQRREGPVSQQKQKREL